MGIVFFEATGFQKQRACHSPFLTCECLGVGLFPLNYQFTLGKNNQVQIIDRLGRESGTPAQVTKNSTFKKTIPNQPFTLKNYAIDDGRNATVRERVRCA
jgi:hypothetical protein